MGNRKVTTICAALMTLVFTASVVVPAMGGPATLSAAALGKKVKSALSTAKRADRTAKAAKVAADQALAKPGTPGAKGDKGDRGPQGEQGPKGDAGEPGSARWFAFVREDGSIEPGSAKGITDANVYKAGTDDDPTPYGGSTGNTPDGVYCITGLDGAPRNAQVTVYVNSLDVQNPQTGTVGVANQVGGYCGESQVGIFFLQADGGRPDTAFYVEVN